MSTCIYDKFRYLEDFHLVLQREELKELQSSRICLYLGCCVAFVWISLTNFCLSLKSISLNISILDNKLVHSDCSLLHIDLDFTNMI